MAEISQARVVSVAQRELTVADSEGREHTLDVADNAHIAINNQPGRLEDLKPRDQATLTVEKHGEREVVTKIEAAPQGQRTD